MPELARIESNVRTADYSPELYPTDDFAGLECLVELRAADPISGIQFRECLIDYTRCPNQYCIKKLL